ncbi:MAG: DUF4007 family protein [Fibrella sp.]|nr:DUF4007 family protein [Armatimonadota bacterium]
MFSTPPDTLTPAFSGHQTFVFRYPWLKKGVDALTRDPAVFRSPDAIVRLGVGKNMVDAIRHWTLSTGNPRNCSAYSVTGSFASHALSLRYPAISPPIDLGEG